jgi:ADP-ribose pyrophosphatase
MDSKKKSLLPWQKLDQKLLQKTYAFDLCVQRLRSPRTKKDDDYFLIDIIDWVNIIPLTKEGKVVMVEQYRFGVHEFSLELPGGMLGKKGEDPKSAAARELLEETGYAPSKGVEVESLGYIYPNPAIQNNKNYFFCVNEVEQVSDLALDEGEDIVVHLIDLIEIPRLIVEHKITHTLVVSAFFRFFCSPHGKSLGVNF